ncbi:MAG: peptide chain release factor [Verrucomicrobiales bacterium]|nr:peptide chain release factor [Verrucomicrobiales bacterium]
MNNMELNEEHLQESFSRSSGPGGQNVNKVSTKVTLVHVPTGLTVTVQDGRSQSGNRALARERMIKMLQERLEKRRLQVRDAKEKARRQKAIRPARVKARMVENKRRRSRKLKERKGSQD